MTKIDLNLTYDESYKQRPHTTRLKSCLCLNFTLRLKFIPVTFDVEIKFSNVLK